MKKTSKDNSDRKLTVNEAKNYVKKGGASCPHCGSGDIEGGSFDMDEGQVSQDLSCNACNGAWRDIYTLTDVQNLE